MNDLLDSDGKTQLIELGEARDVVSLRRCVLKVIEGPDLGKKVDLNRKSLKIGKKEDNDFVLSDNAISRYHLEVSLAGDGFMLSDLDSTNGTVLNNSRIKQVYLSPGDVIHIGNTKIEFQSFDEKIKIKPSTKTEYGEMVGKSLKMRQIFSVLERIAPSLATVIIEGETGTGKELVARAIHNNSPRKDKPFIVFDCSAVAPNLIESELFGHEKGSFTGAVKQHKGGFEAANGGTIFLDEIGELTEELQPKLLRALEQREVRRVGSTQIVKLDVRVVCASNRDLKKEVEAGRFRQDLYYRLSVVKVTLPPLRDRSEDIPLIVEKLLKVGRFNRDPKGNFHIVRVEDDALKMLQRYSWPGNVRELSNVIERAVSLAPGNNLDANHLAFVFQEVEHTSVGSSESFVVDTNLPFKDAKQKVVELFERDYIQELLKKHDYNVSKSARVAEIDRKHLRNLIKKYGLFARDEE